MADTWMKELEEATRIADEITGIIKDATSGGMSRGERSKSLAGAKRKFVILDNKVGRLDNLLQTTLRSQITEKEMYRRQDMVIGLRFRIKQLDSGLKSSQNARDDLLSEGTRAPPAETNKTASLDNYGLIAYQRQTMQEQDEDLVVLEKSVISTKHIALTVNEELDFQTRLLDDLDHHADHTSSVLGAARKKLVSVSKRAGGTQLGCLCLMMLVVVVLVLVILKLLNLW